MTLVTLGLATEFSADGVHANCLWPRTTIATAAIANLLGGEAVVARSRTPAIVADAAHAILTGTRTGQCLVDEDVLAEADITDLAGYSVVPGASLAPDFFLDDP